MKRKKKPAVLENQIAGKAGSSLRDTNEAKSFKFL